MTPAELVPLLLGSTGALVLSLVLNYLFWKGRILNPRATVPREDYDAVKLEAKTNSDSLGILSAAFEKLAKRRTRAASGG